MAWVAICQPAAWACRIVRASSSSGTWKQPTLPGSPANGSCIAHVRPMSEPSAKSFIGPIRN
jgi:hypothetical protein